MTHDHNIVDNDRHFIIDPIKRTISTAHKKYLAQYDHNSERFTFELPRYVEGHDMGGSNIIEIYYKNSSADGKKSNSDVYSADDITVLEDKVYFSWLISGNATKLDGLVSFSISFTCVEDGVKTYSWNTSICHGFVVLPGYYFEKAIDENELNILEEYLARINAAELEVTNAVKVSEQDYTDLEKTQARTNIGAVSKEEVDDQLSEVSKEIDDLSGYVVQEREDAVPVDITINRDGYYNINGTFVTGDPRGYARVDVTAGDKYLLNTVLGSTLIAGILYFDNSNSVVSYDKRGTGTSEKVYDYEFTIPDGVVAIIIQSAYPGYEPGLSLRKKVFIKETTFYDKEEIDSTVGKKYGVRWSVNDKDDLGQRCFGAVGKQATIGIGDTPGYSDFDAIYPWSKIKRCNIKQNANGATIVTYEGDDGFALDGTNGDVFVRIPKFYFDKYIENGFEYRVVSAYGANPHPAFVEDGKELDEIFVSAFEGYIGSDGKLRSIADVIPTNNTTAPEFLTAAKENGDNYSLYDMRCVDAIWTLMAVEFGCRNTNQIIGYGAADYMQADKSKSYLVSTKEETQTNTFVTSTAAIGSAVNVLPCFPVGSNILICKNTQQNILTQAKLLSITEDTTAKTLTFVFDGTPVDVDTTCFIGSTALSTNFCETCNKPLTWHTGRASFVNGSITRNPIRYRWIENVVGNLWHLLPDITFSDLQMYVCNNMKNYNIGSAEGDYKPIGDIMVEQESNGTKADVANANFWITSLVNDVFAKGVSFGKTFDTSLVSTQAFGAYYYLGSEINIIANGGGFDHLWRCNMLTNRAWIDLDKKWYLYGARLMYKHLA